MKPTVAEKLDDILGLEAADETSQEIVVHKPAEIVSSGNPERDMEADIAAARTTIHNLIDKGNELVDHALFFAKEKQDARSVEAAAMAQKEARDNVLALVGIHKTRKEIEKLSTVMTGGSGDTNITQNAVFIGSTGDLLKQMKEMNADGMLKKALKTIDVEADPLNSEEEN
jgi:hypothetical protein